MTVKLFIKLLLAFLVSFYFVSKYTGEVIVKYEINVIENQHSWHGELFYSEDGSYTGKKRRSVRYKQLKNQFQPIKTNLGNQSHITSIRLDPLTNIGMVEIRNLTIKYKDQMHTIDFNKIGDQNFKNNMKIVKRDSKNMLLQCVGTDPNIELTSTMDFNKVHLQDITISIFLVLLIYIFSILIKWVSVQNIVLSTLIIVYSLYALLFLSPSLASLLLIIFAILSLIVAVNNSIPNRILYIKSMGFFLLVYILMSYLSIYTTTDYANLEYLNAKMPYIILASLIPIGFYKISNFNMKFFKIMLTITLVLVAIFIILLDHHMISINDIPFLDYVMQRRKWTQKNYMFWYVLLMFATLSFYNVRKKYELLIILAIIALSYFTIFGGYSRSARLSFTVGILAYSILSVFQIKKKYLLGFIWFLTVYIIFSPIILSFLDLGSYIAELQHRDRIYSTSATLIKEHWFLGYGYGSTLSIHLKDIVSIADLPKIYLNTYPGGHPHNLSLLFWLEFGIFGALFLVYFIHKLLKFFIEDTYLYTNQAALFGMIAAFDIIISFSWSIWYPQVLLTFAFFGAMLVLSMNIQTKKNKYFEFIKDD